MWRVIIKSFDIVQPRVKSSNSAESSTGMSHKIHSSKFTIIVITVFLAGISIGGVGVWFISHKQHFTVLESTTDVQQIMKAVKMHMELPTDETPALATVTDSTKLNTPLLKSALNGDKILIYQNHAIAIIYRPSLDRIVNVGPVSIDKPPTNQN